jgi:hypothetical protein
VGTTVPYLYNLNFYETTEFYFNIDMKSLKIYTLPNSSYEYHSTKKKSNAQTKFIASWVSATMRCAICVTILYRLSQHDGVMETTNALPEFKHKFLH